jgi:predicted RNase H-like nuclease (RuvC/YqgF family)
MAKEASSVRKREREIEKRQRELKRSQRAAGKRERQLKRDRQVSSVPSEDTDVPVKQGEIGSSDSTTSEKPGITEEGMSCYASCRPVEHGLARLG